VRTAALTRQLLVLEHDVLKAIATGSSLPAAMEMLCRRAELLLPSVICSVLLVDGEGRLRPLAGPSLPEEYSAAIDGVLIGPRAGSCGTAAYRRVEVNVEDIATDPLWEDFRHLALPYGLRACWSIPILARDRKPIGTFAFYRRGPRNSDKAERLVAETCIPLCAIAIEHERAHAKAQELAYRDPLTRLGNRAAFFEYAKRLVEKSPPATSFAVFYLGMDRFKEINDHFGHWAGDLLLTSIGRRLGGLGGEGSVVARLGGDEFALFRETIDVADAEAFALRLEGLFDETFAVGLAPVALRAGIGIAFREPGDQELTELMKNAALALYRAKADGGACHRVFVREMAEAVRKRRELESDLRRAVRAGEFFLVYQPIVDLTSGVIHGCEALIRWRTPGGELRMPVEFIGVAEEMGLIAPMGAWVLEEACLRAAGWPADTYVAINLSAVQLRDPAFGAQLAETLVRTGLPAPRLQLEITESVLLAEDPVTDTTLSELRRMGIIVALDDFGTGYSSLRSVRAFRPDKIKIDKSFVGELGDSDRSTKIVRAVIALARNLGMTTTAEGVETAAQVRLLLAEGCGEGQGYHYSRPKPAEDVEGLFAERRLIPERRVAAV